MSNLQKILGGLLLALIVTTAVLLTHMKAHQRLGEPGVKTLPLAGSKRLEVVLPETLPGCTSQIVTNAEATLQEFLPDDTSFRVRVYRANDHFMSELSVVLMGSDRTSIHNPEVCMPGQGWNINHSLTTVEHIQIDQPFPYDLTANKIISTKVIQNPDGKPQTVSGIFVYWFVDATHYTDKSWKWKAWWIPRDLMLNGILERWAYISYFSDCLPGQEEATFDRMKKMIAISVPEFQLVPRVNSVN
jgi:Protein of unknown function (DUF3485)